MASKLAALASLASLVVTTGLLASACASSSAVKEEPVDETTENLLSRTTLKVVGNVDFGTTSAPAKYTKPKYTAFTILAKAGDVVDLWVRSADGDPVTWLLDDHFHVIAKNDDASSSDTSSHLHVTLPPNASPTYYVAVRDYWRAPMTLTVELAGAGFTAPCNVDADCVKVSKVCCSEFGQYTAVRAGQETAYHDSLGCPSPLICPKIAQRPDYQMAECNRSTHTCELVAPKDILCGGFVAPGFQHDCPSGYQCRRLGPMIPDLPGRCYQFCGGIAGIPCRDASEQCIDDPTDGCDPANGGADCGGICKAP